ncbi:MAG TPA: spore germination protein GerW family protein [Terriglobia bacterium]|nr:spore germination protein GerW family protein [Terriglobia bacterium]
MAVAQDILKSLIGELKTLARTETIVGAPFSAGEFTIIPISRVSLGVGAGGGTGGDEKKGALGEGGGGGGGIRIQPVALVAARGGELNVHMLGHGAAFTHTVEKLPELVEKSLEKLLDAWAARKAKAG